MNCTPQTLDGETYPIHFRECRDIGQGTALGDLTHLNQRIGLFSICVMTAFNIYVIPSVRSASTKLILSSGPSIIAEAIAFDFVSQ